MVSPAFPDVAPNAATETPPQESTDLLNGSAGLPSDAGATVETVAPETGASAPASTPTAPAIDPERLATLEREAEEGRKFREDVAKREAQARQQALAKQTKETHATLVKELTEYGYPEVQAQRIAQDVVLARQLSTPEGFSAFEQEYLASPRFQQSEWFQKGREHAVFQEATDLVETQLAPLVPSNYTPRQALAYLQERRKELIEQSKGDRDFMAALVKVWADDRRNQNRQGRIESGAERVENGGGAAVSGMNDQQVWNAYGEGRLPWSTRVQAAGRALGAL